MTVKSLFSGVLMTVLATVVNAQMTPVDPTWRVNALPGEGRFEVVEGVSGGDMRLWCEAGHYAQQQLQADPTERLYVETPRAVARTARGYGVGFTLLPNVTVTENATRPGDNGDYSLKLDVIGFNISVGNAIGLCIYESEW